MGVNNDDWSLSSEESGGDGCSSRSNANATPKYTCGASSRRGSADGKSVITSSGVSRLAVLPTASINASNFRPTTGLARVENRRSSASSSSSAKSNMLIVETAGYYREMIQSKMVEIETEMERLHSETEMADVYSSSRIALDNKHDTLLTTVRKLDASLADYSLAREYARSGTGPAEIKKSTMTIIGTNNKFEKEIDAIFLKRKKVEDEIGSVEAEVKHLNVVFDEKADNDNERLNLHRCLVTQIKAVIAETEQQEDDIVLLRHKVKTIDGDSGNQSILKRVDRMKKELVQVEEDIRIVLMTNDEAREYLLSKIVDMQMSTKEHEDELCLLDSEMQRLNRLQKVALLEKLMGGTEMANARLVDKDNSLKQYLDEKFPVMKAQLENEQRRLLSSIEILRSNINKRDESASNMKLPSKEELDLMKSEVAFTRKHLDSQNETLAMLREMKDKRTDEVNMSVPTLSSSFSYYLNQKLFINRVLSWLAWNCWVKKSRMKWSSKKRLHLTLTLLMNLAI